MHRTNIIILILACLLATLIEGKFPTDPKPCPYGDGVCIKKMLDYLLAEKVDGYAPLNIVPLNPLKISEIHINQGKESPLFIDLKIRNIQLSGIKDGKTVAVKGFGKDLTQPHELVMEKDIINLNGDYNIKGKVLILPITGNGKCNITFHNLKLKFTIFGEPLVKGGETYMKVKELKAHIDASRVSFEFTNLFNGDKALGDNMNVFLNENWKDIFNEIRGSLGSAFASVFTGVIDNVFQKYPYEKFFAPE